MSTIVLAAFDDVTLADHLADRLGGAAGAVESRRFPDEETYVRLLTPVADCDVILAGSLDRPDPKLARLVFLADAARDLGARKVGLVAPYLAHLRQDKRFRPGEAVTAPTFARLLSGAFDWLVTVDPHLHRYASLAEIYSVPTATVHAVPVVAQWIATRVARPLVVGPDRESEQWVAEVARAARAPYVLFEKVRLGDTRVELRAPDLAPWRDRQPVLVDDVISSGGTMIEALGLLARAGLPGASCVAVHALFDGDAHERLLAAGAREVATSDTIRHPSNRFSILDPLADAIHAASTRGC